MHMNSPPSSPKKEIAASTFHQAEFDTMLFYSMYVCMCVCVCVCVGEDSDSSTDVTKMPDPVSIPNFGVPQASSTAKAFC